MREARFSARCAKRGSVTTKPTHMRVPRPIHSDAFSFKPLAMSHRKRKHRQRSDTHSNQYDLQASSPPTRPDHSLFIVAHEADIIRGPQAARLADSLEVGTNVDGQGGSRIGEGLIKLESKVGSCSRDADSEGGDMWVDRVCRLSL